MGLTLLLLAAAPVHAAVTQPACGGDSAPACPQITGTSPSVLAPPTRGATITITGTNLAGVTTAVLIPSGGPLRISAATDTALTLTVPGDLPPGSYSVQLALAGQTDQLQQTPFIAVTSAAGVTTLPAFSFAPAPPIAATVPATPVPKPVAAPVAVTSTSAGHWPLIVIATGLAGGGIGALLLLQRRRRHVVELRDLTFVAMDRRLSHMWATGEQRTVPTRPDPGPHPPLAGIPRAPLPAATPPVAPRPPLASTRPGVDRYIWPSVPASASAPPASPASPPPAAAGPVVAPHAPTGPRTPPPIPRRTPPAPTEDPTRRY